MRITLSLTLTITQTLLTLTVTVRVTLTLLILPTLQTLILDTLVNKAPTYTSMRMYFPVINRLCIHRS